MSPDVQIRGRQTVPQNNLYTVVLAAAFAIVLATTILVATKCYLQYNTIFKVTGPAGRR